MVSYLQAKSVFESGCAKIKEMLIVRSTTEGAINISFVIDRWHDKSMEFRSLDSAHCKVSCV